MAVSALGMVTVSELPFWKYVFGGLFACVSGDVGSPAWKYVRNLLDNEMPGLSASVCERKALENDLRRGSSVVHLLCDSRDCMKMY